MKILIGAALAAILAGSFALWGRARLSRTADAPPPPAAAASARLSALREVEAVVSQWPAAPRRVARLMLDKYGLPDQATGRVLVWNDNGPWKRTVVSRDAATAPLEQAAAYRVPNDRYEPLSSLEGQVSAERGEDELSARSDGEALNFLALNLADEVVTGKRRPEEAREAYRRLSRLLLGGKSSPYAERLLFEETRRSP